MPAMQEERHCTSAPAMRGQEDLALTVLPAGRGGIRKSKNGPRRAAVLIGVHVLILAHLIHWWWAGRTVSPVEPSEAMYTLNKGELNAGFFFFAAAILVTLIFGRYFCGWGCHLVAYQDLCGWLMKKMGVKPKPFRSRVLVYAPLALALYMFVWPTVYRVVAGIPAPDLSNHLTTTQFWKTFPGVAIAIITFGVCGFAIVYVLGAKGFCTYACPYGGFFGLADKFAAGRIVVNDNCEQCGHCTAVCTSNVRVHEEVARFGMVVDPGCMKCMDCVSVCPNEALSFGFVSPIGAKRQQGNEATWQQGNGAARGRAYDFTLTEESLMVVVGLASLLAYRGLYGQIPLLLAMGMAAITAFMFIKFVHLVGHANVKLQSRQFKRGGAVTPAGWAFAVLAAALFVFTVHSGTVQLEFWRGRRAMEAADLGNEVWAPGAIWWHSATPQQQARVDRALARFERGRRWSLMETPGVLQDGVWLHLAKGDIDAAEESVRSLIRLAPGEPEPHRGLGGIMRIRNRPQEAEAAYRMAIELDAGHDAARGELAAMLLAQRRWDDALRVAHDGETASHDPPRWRKQTAAILGQHGVDQVQRGEIEAGIATLRRAIELAPDMTSVRYNLAMALLGVPRVAEAIEHLQQVVRESPQLAEAHYNLAVAVFMSGRPADAVPHAEEALRLSPDDEQTRQFLAMLLRERR